MIIFLVWILQTILGGKKESRDCADDYKHNGVLGHRDAIMQGPCTKVKGNNMLHQLSRKQLVRAI